jgi:exodeoxyribonuclease V alpha subunit
MASAGFKRCDKMWCDFGLPKSSLKRAAVCGWNYLKNEANGHTWLSAEAVAQTLADQVPGCDVKRSLRLAIRSRKLKKHLDSQKQCWLAVYDRAASEDRIATAIDRIQKGDSLWPSERVPTSQVEGDKLPSHHQVDRLRQATKTPLGLFLGGPGTGKTHTLAYLIREIISIYGRSSIRVCAPTGKAANRATQSLALAGIELQATTIHTLLAIGRNGHDGDGWGFQHNRANPLDCQFLIVDESSMVDCDLMANLFDAVPVGGHVLLIGDPYQLPPVGHGAALRDLIEAAAARANESQPEEAEPLKAFQPEPISQPEPKPQPISMGELSEVRRNAGQIVHACVRIKNGESFDVADRIDLAADVPKNLKLIETASDAESVEALLDIHRRLKLFNPVWQTQVIVARNTKGDISRKALNARLHPLLNPDGLSVEQCNFKVGDKIICTRNSWIHVVEPAYTYEMHDDASSYNVVRDQHTLQPVEQFVANGEIGRVVAVAKKLAVARLSERNELVKLVLGKSKNPEEEESEESSGFTFDHAYAVTCHKMQGSESPCVIVMADGGANQLCDRSWWYTAISRAAKLCIIIGSKATIDKQRIRQAIVRRKTFLMEKIVVTSPKLEELRDAA